MDVWSRFGSYLNAFLIFSLPLYSLIMATAVDFFTDTWMWSTIRRIFTIIIQTPCLAAWCYFGFLLLKEIRRSVTVTNEFKRILMLVCVFIIALIITWVTMLMKVFGHHYTYGPANPFPPPSGPKQFFCVCFAGEF